MKLKEGMYVRTNKGKIAKIINQKDTSGGLHTKNIVWVLDNFSLLALHSKKVIKSSFNIIDLIEVGDRIEYELSNIKNWLYIETSEDLKLVKADFKEQDIKSIVTKEQFSQISYNLQKDK